MRPKKYKNKSGYQHRMEDLRKLQAKYDRHVELMEQRFREFYVEQMDRQRTRYEAIIDALLRKVE